MQQALDLPITPRYDFASFISCDGNATALEFAKRLADTRESEQLLYLYGPAGCGKTHLLQAISRTFGGGSRVVSCKEFTSQDTSELLQQLNDLPALLVDDLQLLPGTPALRQALWEAFNRFHTAGLPVALAADAPPRELRNLDDHLTSRLLWGLVARLDVSDDSSRRMLIAKLAADRQILLPDEVAAWLLTVLPRDVGSLVNACETLYRAALEQQRKITLRLARELFSPTSAEG
jgi:chromosomal replication initiator protein